MKNTTTQKRAPRSKAKTTTPKNKAPIASEQTEVIQEASIITPEESTTETQAMPEEVTIETTEEQIQENAEDEAPQTTEELEKELNIEALTFDKTSAKDGLTLILITILFGAFGLHRFYAGSKRILGILCLVLFGIPELLIISLGLVSDTSILPPVVLQTLSNGKSYSWLTTYWDYAKYVLLIIIAIEIVLVLAGKTRDELKDKIRVKPSDEIFAYIIFMTVLMMTIFSYIGIQEAKKHQDPVLRRINQATRYSN